MSLIPALEDFQYAHELLCGFEFVSQKVCNEVHDNLD